VEKFKQWRKEHPVLASLLGASILIIIGVILLGMDLNADTEELAFFLLVVGVVWGVVTLIILGYKVDAKERAKREAAYSTEKEKIIAARKAIQNYVVNNRITKTADYECPDIIWSEYEKTGILNNNDQARDHDKKDDYWRIIADDKEQKVYLFENLYKAGPTQVFPYSMITRCEIAEGTQTESISESQTTGAVFGQAVPFVQGDTKTSVTTYNILTYVGVDIYLKDVSHPKHTLELYPLSGLRYDFNAVDTAKKISGMLDAIVEKSNTKPAPVPAAPVEKQPPKAEPKESNELSDKLQALKKAYEMELLTEEEYKAKKAEIPSKL